MTTPLLQLSEERVALELRRMRQRLADDRSWRRRLWLLGFRCVGVYLVGLSITWTSLYFTGDQAQMALWLGLLLGNAGPLAFACAFWARENG